MQRITSTLVALGFIFSFLSSPCLSQDNAQLVTEAKKEKKIVYYTASNLSDATSIAKGFEARYPGIDVEVFRSGSQGLVNRVANEHRAQRYFFDVVSVNSQVMNTLSEDGILGKYISPESKYYQEGLKNPEGFWTGLYSNVYVVVYNRKLVSAEEAPKTYQDLSNPKWRGKIMKDRNVPQWFVFMIQQLGKEKGLSMMRALAANDLIYRNGATLIVQLVAAGESPLGFPVKGQEVEELKKKGASIDWTRPKPNFVSSVGMGISSNPPHPHGARLFVDYVLSKEGQEIIAGKSRIPARSGIKHNVPRLTEGAVFPASEVLSGKEYQEMSKLYLEVFKSK
jgi:ABC-type Fe3+ transport system substrate-binding protein